MNSRMLITGIVCAALAVWVNGSASAQNPPPVAPDAPTGSPLGTQITYQGQLQQGGKAFSGTCTLVFQLFDAATGGAQVGTTLTTTNVAVSNGIFAVGLDFGNQFTGDARWMQTAVKCGADAGFTVLSPRQPQNAVPYTMGLRPGTTIKSTGYALRLEGSGSAKDAALFQAHNTNPDGGMSAYMTNNSQFATAHFANNGNGNVLYLETVNGRFIEGVNNGTKFLVSSNGNVQATALGVNGTGYAKDGALLQSHNTNPDGGMAAYLTNNSQFATSHFVNEGNGNVLYLETSKGTFIQAVNSLGGDPKFSVSKDGRTTTKVVEIQGGSDIAERFAQSEGPSAEPGTLVIIDEAKAGQLKISDMAYDPKVLGIVSGAGGINTGLTLHQQGALEGDLVVAVAGRVYAKCEAISTPIKPGDLLTTSNVPGHCMTATNRDKRDGAVIGKAITGLASGQGLVLVMVNLK